MSLEVIKSLQYRILKVSTNFKNKLDISTILNQDANSTVDTCQVINISCQKKRKHSDNISLRVVNSTFCKIQK